MGGSHLLDKRVYMLTFIAFVVGMAELIIGGILDLVANDLSISISKAGLLISIFAVVFAISAPIFLVTFRHIERTRLTIISLIIFLIGNLLVIFSSTFPFLIVARIISAASGSLVVVLCINLASQIVEEAYRGRAIGLVVMGISGSLVLGLPIGVMVGNIWNWRAPFILISILTIVLLIFIPILIGKVAPTQVTSIRQQIASLKRKEITFAHLTTFFFISGHYVLYGFLTPYTKTVFGFDGTTISVLYFVFGIAAVSGGGLGGLSADRFGKRQTVLAVIVLLAACLFVIPYSVKAIVFFWVILIVWGVISWAISPPIHSHLVQVSPETSNIQQSLNNAALHLGIAFGTFTGSFIVAFKPMEQLPHFGLLLIVLAFISAMTAMKKNHSFN